MLKLNRLARDASFVGCLRDVAQHLRCVLFDTNLPKNGER